MKRRLLLTKNDELIFSNEELNNKAKANDVLEPSRPGPGFTDFALN